MCPEFLICDTCDRMNVVNLRFPAETWERRLGPEKTTRPILFGHAIIALTSVFGWLLETLSLLLMEVFDTCEGTDNGILARGRQASVLTDI